MKLFYKILAISFPVLVLYIFTNRILYSEATKSFSDRLVLHTVAKTDENEGDGAEETSDLKPSPDTQEDATDTPRPSSDNIPRDEQSIAQIDKTSNDSQSDIVKPNDEGNIFFSEAVLLSENNTNSAIKQSYEEMNEVLKKKPSGNKALDILTQQSKDANGSLTEKSVSTLEDRPKENISNDSEAKIKNFNTGIINQTEDKQKIIHGNETANVNLVNGLNYNLPENDENRSSPRLSDDPIQPSESANRDTKQSESASLAEQNSDNNPSQPSAKENNVPVYNMSQLKNNDTNNYEEFPMSSQKSQEIEDNSSSKLPMLLAAFSKSAEPNTVEAKQGVNEPNLAVSNSTVPNININQSKIFSRKERKLHQEEPKVSESKTSSTDLFQLYNFLITTPTEENLDVNATESEHMSDIKPIQPQANYNQNDVTQFNDEGLAVKSEVPPQKENTSILVKITETVTGTDELDNPTKYTVSNDDNDSFIVSQNNNVEKHKKPLQESNSQDVNVTAAELATDNNDKSQRADNEGAYVVSLSQPSNIGAKKNELPPQESNSQDINVTAPEPATDNNDTSQRADNEGAYVVSLSQPSNIGAKKNELPPQESNSSSPVNQHVSVTAAEPANDNNDTSQRTDNDVAYVVSLNQPNNIGAEKNELPPQESNSSSPANVSSAEPATDNNDKSQRTDNDGAYVVSLSQPNNIGAEKNELPPQEEQTSNNSYPNLSKLP